MIEMRHPVTGGLIVVDELAAPIHARSGWQPTTGPELHPDVADAGWNGETEMVDIYHPVTGGAASVPAISMIQLRQSGWITQAEREYNEAQAAQASQASQAADADSTPAPAKSAAKSRSTGSQES